MRCAFLVVLLGSTVFAAEPDVSSRIETLAKSFVEWGTSMSTPGATLAFKEVSREGRKRTYHVVIAGLPLEGSYAILQWPITMEKPAVLMNPVFIDVTGILHCRKGGDVNSSNDTVNLIMDSIPGEPARTAVVSLQDKSLRALGKITSQPLEATDKLCHLGVTYLTGHGEVVFVEASALAAGEGFTMTMNSGAKDVKQEAKASSAGVYRVSFLLFDPKASSGKRMAEVRMQAPSCSPSIAFPWGNLAEK